MSLVEMSVSGAVMILVIAVVRAVALNKLPKRTFLALWGIALARLMLPYTLPSQVSVYSLWERLDAWMNPIEPPSGVRVYRMVGDAPVTTVGTAATAVSAAPRVSEAVTVDPWFAIWLVGVIICVAAMVEMYVRCRREFRESLPVDSDFVERWLREHPLRRRLSVRQSDRVSTPLTYGIVRPVILLPKNIDLGDERTLEYVLTHELVHIRRFDAVSKLLLVAAVCVHWFNPLVWVMYVLANRDLEISCDEAVIRTLGGESKADYARALIRMEERRSGLSAFYNGFSKNATEERIVSIMKSKKTSVVAIFMAVALILGTGAVLATSAAEPPDDMTLTDSQGGVTKLTTPKVEWWTYDEYKEWLENEKVELQSMLGEKGWTQSRGDFVWTQEMIDETIAMYEQTLEDIKNGYLVSKTVDGDDNTMLMMNPSDVWLGTDIPPIDEYEPFGITLNEQEDALYYNGEKVKWFEDSVEAADGGVSSRCNYYRPDGSVSLRVVRETVQNDDGSTDPFGPIIRLEKLSDGEVEQRLAQQITLGQVATTEVIVSKGDEIAIATDFMLPIEPEDKLVISNGFSAEHKGVDIAAPKGTLVFAIAGGSVTEVGFDETLGNFVKIEHENGYASLYAHLGDVEVEENATVDMGAVIGKVGASGKATGANLHFELSVEGVPTDPESFYGLTADVETRELLDAYKAVGLEYKYGMDGTLSMSYKGKPVHSLYDGETGAWFANNLNGSDLGDDAIDLEAVYEDGKLVGLKETKANHGEQYAVELVPGEDDIYYRTLKVAVQNAVASGDETSEGVPLPNMFDKYAPYGLVYEEKQTSSGTERNLSLNGKHVNHFVDTSPDGGVFTFGSSTQTEDGITVHALYDNGEFVGVAEVVACGYPMV